MKGRDLQKGITDLLTLHQWRWTHFQSVLATGRDGKARWRTPLSGTKGFPDIIAVRGDEALAIEVKGDGDKVRPEQQEWLDALNAAGIRTLVATPANWRSGYVDGMLRRKRYAHDQ